MQHCRLSIPAGNVLLAKKSRISLLAIKVNSLNIKNYILSFFVSDSIPDGLAVDSESSLLYYTDAGRGLIGVVDTVTLNHYTLFENNIEKPRAIVLDSIEK